MFGKELSGRAQKLEREQKERAERARRKVEAERIAEERARKRREAHEEEQRLRRLEQLQREEQERLRHEEEIERNNGVWMRQELQAVGAPEDAARTKGIRRGIDKVLLPRSIGNELMAQDAPKNGAMFFELATPGGADSTHVGVLDFTGAEGTVEMPPEVVRSLWGCDAAGPSGSVLVTYRRLEKGTYVRFQPESAEFQKEVAEDVREVLEAALLSRSALSVGDWVEAEHAGRPWRLRVQQLQPASAVSVIDTDMEAEVEPSLETERRLAAEAAAAERRRAELAAIEAAAEAALEEAMAREAQQQADAERLRQEKAASVPAEPPTDAGEPITTCLIRLPDGTRQTRRFLLSHPLQALFDFVDSLGAGGQPPGQYRLVGTFPRRVFTPENGSCSLAEAGIAAGQEALMLEPVST